MYNHCPQEFGLVWAYLALASRRIESERRWGRFRRAATLTAAAAAAAAIALPLFIALVPGRLGQFLCLGL